MFLFFFFCVSYQRAEIAVLQRQNQSQSLKFARRVSSAGQQRRPSASSALPEPMASYYSPAELDDALQSRSATIESMEVGMSSLQAQLSEKEALLAAQREETAALERKLDMSETAASTARLELDELKRSLLLSREGEQGSTEGGERSAAADESSSTTTTTARLASVERQLAEKRAEVEALQRKCDALEKKVLALTTLHREVDARAQALAKERDGLVREAAELRRTGRPPAAHNRGGNAVEGEQEGEEEGADPDDERQRLRSRVRQLEGEVFELKRGAWQKRRKELDGGDVSPTAPFDDVDLGSGGGGGGGGGGSSSNNYNNHNNAGSKPGRGGGGGIIPKGQSLSDMLTGGLSALTSGALGVGLNMGGVGSGGSGGAGGDPAYGRPAGSSARASIDWGRGGAGGASGGGGGGGGGSSSFGIAAAGPRKSADYGRRDKQGAAADGMLDDVDDDDDDLTSFDEDAFRLAHEEEARKRVERVREAKFLEAWCL